MKVHSHMCFPIHATPYDLIRTPTHEGTTLSALTGIG